MQETPIELVLPGGTSRVRVRGDGPALLWSHGLFHSMAIDDTTAVGALARASGARRLVRLDARGHGGSGAGRDDEVHRWDRLGADLLALADGLKIERFALGGFSMGVAASLHAAVTAPGRVSALVLVCPPTAWGVRAAQVRAFLAQADEIERSGMDQAIGEVREILTRHPDPPGLAHALEDVLAHMRTLGVPTVARVLRGAARSDLPSREEIAALRVPALVVGMERDAGHPIEVARELSRLLAAELVVSDRLDDPRLADAVRAFLDRDANA